MSNVTTQGWEYPVAPQLPAGWTASASGFTTETGVAFSGSQALQFFNTSSGQTNLTYSTAPDTYRGNSAVRSVFRFKAVVAAQQIGVYLRSDIAGNNNYAALLEPTGAANAGIGLYKTVSSTQTQLGSTVGTGAQIALNAWFKVILQAKNSTITVYVERMSDGAWLNSSGNFVAAAGAKPAAITQTDTTFHDAGYAGITANQNPSETQVIYADNFGFDTLQAFVTDNSSANESNGTTLTINVPGSTIDGDLLVAAVNMNPSVASTITAPGGWTQIRSDSNSTYIQAIYYHIAQGEPASYNWTFSNAADACGGMVAVRSADIADAIPDVSGFTDNGTTTAPTAPSVTTTVINDLLLFVWGQPYNNGGSMTPPVGVNVDFATFASAGASTNGCNIGMGDMAYGGPGPTDPQTASAPANFEALSQTVALLSLGPPPWDGTWGPSQFIQFPDPYKFWSTNEVVGYC